MKITLIGTGNAATVLGKLFKQSGHSIVAVAGRNEASGLPLATNLDATFIEIEHAPNTDAEIFIIAVTDAAVREVASKLNTRNRLVVHTAGSVPKDVLKKCSENYGVLYPLQTLRKEMTELPEVPFLIDANSQQSINTLQRLASSASNRVEVMTDDQRAGMHLAAVIVSNFCNHLYDLAAQFCKGEHLDFNLLYPLILETASRLKNNTPDQLKTGPAVRKDISTLEKHLRLLSNYPKLKTTYTRLTDSIMYP